MSQHSERLFPDILQIETVVHNIFPSTSLTIERVLEGVSTFVYRITHKNEVFYLRVLPEEGASFAPEVAAHAQLRQRQINVPEVIYFEHYNELLQHSIMVTSAIKGEPISQSADLSKEEREEIVTEAGRDLARIKGVPVEGFGWIKRNESEPGPLQAEWSTLRAFALEYWEADLTYLGKHVLLASETAALERVLSSHNTWLDLEQGYLAHGDFDITQIYQDRGRYTGLIDFGEIRGTDPWYDLGHFHMRDGEELSFKLEMALIRGYGEVIPLPEDYKQRICFMSLLINVRALARSLQKRPANRYTLHQLRVLREDLTFLL